MDKNSPTNVYYLGFRQHLPGDRKIPSMCCYCCLFSFNLSLWERQSFKTLFFFYQIDPLHALAGGDICFSPPFGKQDEEVFVHYKISGNIKSDNSKMCLCKKDGCNKDSNTARASLGLHQKAAWVFYLVFLDLVQMAEWVFVFIHTSYFSQTGFRYLLLIIPYQVNHLWRQGLPCDGSFKGAHLSPSNYSSNLFINLDNFHSLLFFIRW